MSELFDAPESLSPRLKWIKKHRINTCKSDPDSPLDAWVCWSGHRHHIQGRGETEDQAIANLAKRSGLKLWNKEKLK